MKKVLSAVLVLALLAIFTACSDSSQETSSVITTQTPTTKPVPTTKPQEVPVFEPVVFVDNEALLFQINAASNDPIWGYTLKAHMENRTDQDLMFTLEAVSVNGYMCDPFFAATVTAGMKANKDISFSLDSFASIGIDQVTDVTFTLRVYDRDDITADHVLEEEFVLYPLGQDQYKEYPRQPKEHDIVLVDNDQCAVILTGFETGAIWGFQAHVYLVNKTENALMFSVGDASLNGFMCDPFFAQSVAAGKQCITEISWTKESLKQNNIETVTTMTLPLMVYDSDNWLADALVNETFTVNL